MISFLRKAIILGIIGGMLGFNGCETLPERSPKIKNGKAYGVTRGAFRHRWWNYYERARSFADGGFWVDAELDLRAAIRQREADQRMARTYGMHFVDYFPHAELGAALYHQASAEKNREKMNEAIDELERSVAEVKSAKAEYYLDLARRALIRMEEARATPPEIIILSPKDPAPTNALTVTVRGRALDRKHFVQSIQVGETPVRIDVSKKEIAFEVTAPLKSGLNRIPIRAANLLGKTAETHVTVTADRFGPIIRTDGWISDPSGVIGLSVDGTSYPVSGKELHLEDAMPEIANPRRLMVRAKDRAGNVTTAELMWPPKETDSISALLYAEKTGPVADWRRRPAKGPRLAAVGMRDVGIELWNPDTARTTYLEHAVIDGAVHCDEGSFTLTIQGTDGREILQLEPTRRTYYFSYLAALNEGMNWFDVRAVAPSRKSDDLTLRIHRKLPSVRKAEARMKLLVSPFEREKTQDVTVQLSLGFEDRLVDALTAQEPARFARVLGFDPSNYADQAIDYARKNGFHYLLSGQIEERKNSAGQHTLIVKSQFEDLEGTPVVGHKDTEVYGEDLNKDNSPKELNKLSAYMGVKLIDELPMVEGQVLKKNRNEIDINIGKAQKVRPGINLIVYKLLEEEGAGSGHETKELGLAKIKKISEKQSKAVIYGGERPDAVAPEHYVITQ